jgi:hypothetical protein
MPTPRIHFHPTLTAGTSRAVIKGVQVTLCAGIYRVSVGNRIREASRWESLVDWAIEQERSCASAALCGCGKCEADRTETERGFQIGEVA